VGERQGEDDRCQTEAANDDIRKTPPAAAGTPFTAPAASAGGSWEDDDGGLTVKTLKGTSQKVRRAQMLLKVDAEGPREEAEPARLSRVAASRCRARIKGR
jgi:hypothetical protein